MSQEDRRLSITMDVLSRLNEGASAAFGFASRKHGVTEARIRQAFWKCLARHRDQIIDALGDQQKPHDERKPTYSELHEALDQVVAADELRSVGVSGDMEPALKQARRTLTRTRRAQFPSLVSPRR